MAIDVKIKAPAQDNRTTARGEEAAYRPPTHHLEAEQGLLGALLMDNSALEKVSDVLRPCHFYTPVYQRLYEAILKLTERGQIASPVTLKNSFERDREFEHVGGAQYLADLASNVISLINAEHDARTIHDLYVSCQLTARCQETLREAYEARLEREQGAADIIEQTEGRLFRLAETGEGAGGIQTLALLRSRKTRPACRSLSNPPPTCPSTRSAPARGA